MADSFYLTNNEGHTYRVYQKDRDILMFAGIYDHHISQRGINKTFAIITTPSNRDTIQLNKRNPVIFSKEERKKWLNKNTGINDVLSLLKVNESYSLVSYRITDAINNSSLNNPILHEEIGVSNMLFDF